MYSILLQSDILKLMHFSNIELAKILRHVAAALTIKKIGNFFQIRAYDSAADSIEHSDTEVYDLWQEGHLNHFPGIGAGLRVYIEELFKTGKVEHFIKAKEGIPEVVFELLDIPGVGPKTAQQISGLGIKSIEGLKNEIKTGELVNKGFSAKLAQKVMSGIAELSSRSGRMLLNYAHSQAQKIIEYMKLSKDVIKIDSLGSLRRMTATVGDLDFAVSSENPQAVVKHFCYMPFKARVLDEGDKKASIFLKSGIQADLLVGDPLSYGSLLQHFTGSKNHNIHLRKIALEKGMSLSEYGITEARGKKQEAGVVEIKTEEELYQRLGMEMIAPELREDTGEIEAAASNSLPKLVEVSNIKGDLHLHSNFPLQKPSHAPGVDSIEDIVKYGEILGYSYIGISDHSPSPNLSLDEVKATIEKRTKFIHSLNTNTKSIRVLNGLEIDILKDGALSVPDEILQTLDYCIAGIHSGHGDSREAITKRLISALSNPYVNIISHPTGRLLNERNSSDADWEEVFKVAAKNRKILEINSHPIRLDLRDDLVRLAKKFGVKFIIDTDAHEVPQMDNMRYGVSVARRGWAEEKDIINTLDWTEFVKWFRIK